MAKKEKCEKKWHHHADTSGGVYGLAFVGALIYFLQRADSFWTVVLGILKAIIWPVLVVYHLLKYLNL
ncbi:MAG: hypothetical protein A2044_04085 [Candidatus Firestonebacteria bacterium GWA2_43_8]|nr:MAG: hypothetical protein A2044_04085 [Candidatus Firestonebacteria bacterium GWA2_43_8]